MGTHDSISRGGSCPRGLWNVRGWFGVPLTGDDMVEMSTSVLY